MGARFVGKIYVFQTAQHANCDSEYDIYHIRGLYSGLTVIHTVFRLSMYVIHLRSYYYLSGWVGGCTEAEIRLTSV